MKIHYGGMDLVRRLMWPNDEHREEDTDTGKCDRCGGRGLIDSPQHYERPETICPVCQGTGAKP